MFRLLADPSSHIVRQARGDAPRQRLPQTPVDPKQVELWDRFHEKTPNPYKRILPVESDQEDSPGDSNRASSRERGDALYTPFKTPRFEFRTPSGRSRAKPKIKEEFAKNVHKEEFDYWLSFLHRHGVKTRHLAQDLKNTLFPSKLILKLHHELTLDRPSSIDHWNILVNCFSHEGFMALYDIKLPQIKVPDPIDFEKSEHSGKIIKNSAIQQSDGCCVHCRGFSWAGKLEIRELPEDETKVPVRSQHKLVKPYIPEELADFSKHNYTRLFERWCQESRWDWIFEEPKLETEDEGTKFAWKIPQDDPRLRHIAIKNKEGHRLQVQTGEKWYYGDSKEEYESLIGRYTKQDIAARLLIDAVSRQNPELGQKYEDLNLERKRRQVKANLLCVRQVKVVKRKAAKDSKKPSGALTEMPRAASKLARGTATIASNKRTRLRPEASPSKRVKFSKNFLGPSPRKTTAQLLSVKSILKPAAGNSECKFFTNRNSSLTVR